ncbi:MAG: threonine--tRNA ligase [Vampirovibrionales bacterium]|nr:threonine--tRNA ligase [Vampirovibrionales bacterium]
MTSIQVNLPDGSVRELPAGATAYDLAAAIGPGLAKSALASVVNGQTRDLLFPLQDGDTVRLLTKKDKESLDVLRHSSAHILAQAVQNLFPGTKVATGPNIENGFYYDFDIPNHKLSPEDFEKIEAEIKRICAQSQVFERQYIEQLDGVEARLKEFNEKGERYKAEILDKYKNDNPTIYVCKDAKSGETIWYDLCEGPHLPDTSWIKAIKLMSVSGAYWRGDDKNPMLQRVYATSFWDQKDVDAYIRQLEEAERRDHRKIGKEQHLFSIEEEVGSGLILWHPSLACLREELENYWRTEHRKRGYDIVYTPHIAKRDLWDCSGHTNFYMENMYTMEIDEQEYIVKPMNCPFHVLIFKSRIRSYRELPVRLSELGTVYRYEKSGTMHGLSRVRGFTQDDAHLFCRIDQITDEVLGVIKFVDDTLKLFNMEFEVELSTRPEKFIGDKAVWDKAEEALKIALEQYGLAYEVNEGDGAFYGPKIDFKLKDAIGRTWQCSTVQLDFNLPERFELKYTDSDGQAKQPIMIHRAIFGSLERFAGTLIEHYAGAFPTWLAPTQVIILPIADRHIDYCQQLEKQLREQLVRVKVDSSNEGIGKKIRDAQLAKIPYMLVIGDKEMEAGQVAVRSRSRGDLGAESFSAFSEQLLLEIKSHGTQEVTLPPVAVS